MEEAKESMVQSLEKSLFGDGGPTSFKDIYRDAGGFHVHKDAGTMEEVFLLRLAEIHSSVEEPMPKTQAAADKRELAKILDLPTARYRHAMKFKDGSFKSVSLFKSPHDPLTAAAVRKATGKNETSETEENVS